jgi:uncharacterized protein (DUF885 family)
MKKVFFAVMSFIFAYSCTSPGPNDTTSVSGFADSSFKNFESRFLDAYWKQYPGDAIFIGYGKYYDRLTIPDSTYFASINQFSSGWIDSLHVIPFDSLNDNNKISYRIINNQLQSDRWYNDTLKSREWNPASYNISGECYYILTQPWAPLDERLKTLSAHIEHADSFYHHALLAIHHPVKEFVGLAIQQNQGGLDVFGKDLMDSLNKSHLYADEKDSLKKRVARCTNAMKEYINALTKMLADRTTLFKDYRLGKELYNTKFKYDLITSYTPEEIVQKAMEDKVFYQQKMYGLAQELWPKYCKDIKQPTDSLELVKTVIDRISLHHANPAHLLDTLTKQVHALQTFILAKDLFNYDTTFTLKVRLMPAYERGVALANAESIPPYQKAGTTFFNIEDLSQLPNESVEGTLREYNDYSIQYLTIHEAMPGHCLQGIYSNTHSPDIIKSVFQNGTMVEGWAVYCEAMMLEQGWGNHTAEMELFHDKWKLRELCNVILDYGVQCLNYSREDVAQLLKKGAFQTDAQINEKYHRATVSQVQLCSYYAGFLEIMALREDFKKKIGDQYQLKDFHEKFLSYGSAPVKYIREMMIKLDR